MKLHKTKTTDGIYYSFWCLACQRLHSFVCERPENQQRPSWSFNGDFDKPTFTPSLLQYITHPDGTKETLCHLFVREGKIEYCSDNPTLAGQTLMLPDIPTNQQLPSDE